MNSFKPALAATLLWAALAMPVRAQEEAQKEPAQSGSASGPNGRNFWGGGLGLVFTDIPISNSEFTVIMSELHYGWYLTDPNESFRTAATLGLYGFAGIIPVPKVSVEAYVGEPTQDIQGKLGVSGFYDIAVGGHGGVAIETGVRIKNRIDVSLFVVPTGADAERDYLEFMGMRDEGWAEADSDRDGTPNKDDKPHVIMPYFGIFVGFNF